MARSSDTEKPNWPAIRKRILDARGTVAELLPAGVDVDRFLRATISAVNSTPALLRCDADSIISAVGEAARLGLEVGGPLAEAWIIPRKGRAVFQPGVRGLIKLAHKGQPRISSIDPVVVYDGDVFKPIRGTTPGLIHEESLTAKRSDATLVAVYAVVAWKDAGPPKFDWMNREEVDKVMASSSSKDEAGNITGPWSAWYGEMAKKSVVKRIVKTIPMETDDLARALELDTRAEIGEATAPLPHEQGAAWARTMQEQTAARLADQKAKLLGTGIAPATPVSTGDPEMDKELARQDAAGEA